jgi:hydrogenase nickel incorporation protein HypA/HybF
MHELTLLFGIAEQVEKVVNENDDIDHIDAVVVDIGELTTVVPEFMLDGYSVVSDEFDFLKGSELIINRIKGVARCTVCDTEYEIVPNEGLCPNCGAFDKDVLAGDDFYIREVRIYEKGS